MYEIVQNKKESHKLVKESVAFWNFPTKEGNKKEISSIFLEAIEKNDD